MVAVLTTQLKSLAFAAVGLFVLLDAQSLQGVDAQRAMTAIDPSPAVTSSTAPTTVSTDPATHEHEHQRNRKLEAIRTTTENLAAVGALFNTPMEIKFTKLFTSTAFTQGKAARVPWPGHYWPLVNRGIDFQWNEPQPSPAVKYAQAYGMNVAQLQDSVFLSSGIFGVDLTVKRPQCSNNAQCGGDNICVPFRGYGYCAASWEGLCHAWAPAAILEQEPQCAVVTANGVRFEPLDIKALLTHSYLDSRAQALKGNNAVGTRYYGPNTPNAASALRDVNPASLHIILANIMGKLGKSFVIDRTASEEVWNQPVRNYTVLTWQMYAPAIAAKTFFGTSTYLPNTMAAKIVYVKTALGWIKESIENGRMVPFANTYSRVDNLEYLLEVDSNDNIIGGEWLRESVMNHPDFLWFATEKPSLTSDVGGIKYANVASLLAASLKCGGAGAAVRAPATVTSLSVASPANFSVVANVTISATTNATTNAKHVENTGVDLPLDPAPLQAATLPWRFGSKPSHTI